MRRAVPLWMRTVTLPRAPSANEQQLFDFLLAVNSKYGLQTTLRVAGGWVRDMLLATESHDIDIALDGPAPPDQTEGEPYMTGAKFAEYIQRYQQESGEQVHSVGVVKANPGQSKHLETATTKVCNFEIDLVHLRKEDYASDSRIPVISRASPEEDASRRDLTINALFYNLHTRLAEDFTDKGLDDLQARYVRTPLPALETFRDDPLRLLRCIRFACKLDFVVDPPIVAAAHQVRDDLEQKVSRERVGIEIGKMFEGPAPHRAARILMDCGVRDTIFTAQQVSKKKVPEGPMQPLGWDQEESRSWARSQALIDYLATSPMYGSESDRELRQVMNLAALLFPVAPTTDLLAPLGVQYEVIHNWLETVTTHSLKLPNRIGTSCSHLIVGAKKFPHILQPVVEGKELDVTQLRERLCTHLVPNQGIDSWRVVFGEWLKFVGAALWKPAVHLSCCTMAVPLPLSTAAFAGLLIECMEQMEMVQCCDLKPLVRGDKIQKDLGLPKGPSVGIATSYLVRLQMASPSFSEEQLMAAMQDYVDDIKAKAAPKRAKA
mmetsp:Transcript_28274/g.50867  ORF Transcript_28274/g.50867 Transcript_28274/m.50867 type:complete len:548 (-) Transcript_28274:213-1856(-)